jgi:hypothetical protein
MELPSLGALGAGHSSAWCSDHVADAQIDGATLSVVICDDGKVKLVERSATAEYAVILEDQRTLLQLVKYLATLKRVFEQYQGTKATVGNKPFR